MFEVLKKIFKKKDNDAVDDSVLADEILNALNNDIDEIDYSGYSDPTIITDGREKTIFFLDDIEDMWYLYSDDFDKMKDEYNVNVFKDFNLIKCFGVEAGFMAHKYLLTKPKIDYAILDITLGFGIKLNGDEYIEYDGIDIFLELYELNPDIKFIFCTAHTMNRNNPVVNFYFKKFETATGLNFKDHYVNKNSSRYKDIYKLLYGENYESR